MQEDRPVAFASRTLTKVERNSYAPIEKECLAIVFACYRFEQYIYGKENVIVESDHKPLQAIFGKPLVSAPKRLQGMLLCLQMFDLTVKYKKGSKMYIADMLSRAALPETDPCGGSLNARQEEVCMVNIEEVNSTEFSRISEDGMKSIQAVTNRDDQLQILKQVILRG